MKREPVTPAELHLFDTAENSTKLYQTNSELLHNSVAHILYL